MKSEYESRESSSPMITRAVASALENKTFSPYEFSTLQKIALQMVGTLPQEIASWLIPMFQTSSALDGEGIEDLKMEDLIHKRLDDYSQLDKTFPAIISGVGMGGTTAHLCTSLGGPFLPQAFVLTIKGGSINGDAQYYENLSKNLALRITDRNPEVMSIQHYDPIHDGWLVKYVNHLRLKLIDLPEGYKAFIKEHLEPGGEIIYLEGKAKWLRYRLGARNVFQVGGWGDIPAKEFLEGSDRIQQYCRKEKINSNWKLTDYELEEGPESEWGSEPGLKEALQHFCEKEGFRFVPIGFADPNDFSRLAFSVSKKRLEMSGYEPEGGIVEMFSQYDPDAVENYGLLPLWLIFNTADSARFLNSMIKEMPHDKPIFFSPLSTFSHTPDMADFEDWENCLKGFDTVNIGARKDHYPSDASALVNWNRKLVDWKKKQSKIHLHHINGIDLTELAKKL